MSPKFDSLSKLPKLYPYPVNSVDKSAELKLPEAAASNSCSFCPVADSDVEAVEVALFTVAVFVLDKVAA